MKAFPKAGVASRETAGRTASSRLWFLDLLRGLSGILHVTYYEKED